MRILSRSLLSRRFVALTTVLIALAVSRSVPADEPTSRAESPMVKMLRSGRVPADRQGTVIEMIGKRGSAADLDFLLDLAGSSKTTPAHTLRCLEALSEAALTRNLRPSGDLGRLASLIPVNSKVEPNVSQAAVRLAGLWKAESLGPKLRAIAEEAETPAPLRAAALEALAAIGGKEGRASIEDLTTKERPLSVRALAVAALVRLDLAAAAKAAARVLGDAGKDAGQDDLIPMIAAFLNHQGGANTLASAMNSGQKIPADAARLALRGVYALGHSDPGLVASLTKAAGLDAEVKALDPKSMEALISEVATRGNPALGESIFRRADLNCTKCHALSGAGGGVGPDLSALGSSSPVDYVINSIMLPDQAIKEEFHTLVVVTTDGQIFQGIVADKDDKRVVLKEATGSLRTIPTLDIDESKEGGSLMPKGLVNFMTRAEFVDLVRFLSELGKPGPYAIRSTPTIQRWRYHKARPGGSVPNSADPTQWQAAYARTGGDLPLGELTSEAGTILDLQAEVDVSQAGAVVVKLNDPVGVTAWVDDQPAPAFSGPSFPCELAAGRHRITFQVDTTARRDPVLRAEVLKGPGSTVEFSVVGGR